MSSSSSSKKMNENNDENLLTTHIVSIGKNISFSAAEVFKYVRNMHQCMIMYHNMLRAANSRWYSGKIGNTDLKTCIARLIARTPMSQFSMMRSSLINIACVNSPAVDREKVLGGHKTIGAFCQTLFHMSTVQQSLMRHTSDDEQRLTLGGRRVIIEPTNLYWKYCSILVNTEELKKP